MTRIAYTVTASFSDQATAEGFVEWLRGGHVDAVIAGGAQSAMIVRLDPEAPSGGAGSESGQAGGFAGAAIARPRVEVRYVFPSRADFERYLTIHAPALRAQGLMKFGPAQGVSFSRSVGAIAE